MTIVVTIEDFANTDRSLIGDKAFTLGFLHASGLPVPGSVCVTTEAYKRFASETGLKDRIFMELNRKPMRDMRWEEMWDCALRIRNMFVTTDIPVSLYEDLLKALESLPWTGPVAVRCSAPGEDSSAASFAGIHESFVNISGADTIIDHIKLVWASLWSDRALLYKRELNLNHAESAMAVLVQEMIFGDVSGVVFGQSPTNPSQCVIEAVYGLNQGLVDGIVEPDRWIMDRETGQVLSQTTPEREIALRPDLLGARSERLDPELTRTPPLSSIHVSKIYDLVMRLETLLGAPQDCEWTLGNKGITLLQSRPITVSPSDAETDDRKWYLSLRRSFENLQDLREKIEQELLPSMDKEADELNRMDIRTISDADLVEEIQRRKGLLKKWTDVYWEDFIPMAHGIRLFGQVYNDTIRPEDPYEFLNLLVRSGLLSVERNRQLFESDTHGADQEQSSSGSLIGGKGLSSILAGMSDEQEAVKQLLSRSAKTSAVSQEKMRESVQESESSFLSRFDGNKRDEMERLLDLARASYRLRDDDNLYIGRIEAELHRSIREAKRRMDSCESGHEAAALANIIVETIREKDGSSISAKSKKEDTRFRALPRQLVGQPAGPGLAVGKARVIHNSSDLFDFQEGEALVCDAVDPNMTFIVPLCVGIVERRGGMLIHGAIIAREYGLPCVTGVPQATVTIRTGQTITIDGYLGIVTVGS